MANLKLRLDDRAYRKFAIYKILCHLAKKGLNFTWRINNIQRNAQCNPTSGFQKG